MQYDLHLRRGGVADLAETNPFHEELLPFCFFYDAFVPQRYYWGLLLMGRKCFAVILMTQIRSKPMFAAEFYGLILFMACVLQLTRRPYTSDAETTAVYRGATSPSSSSASKNGRDAVRVKLAQTGISINLQVRSLLHVVGLYNSNLT